MNKNNNNDQKVRNRKIENSMKKMKTTASVIDD